MLFFGHTSITLTVFYALDRFVINRGRRMASLIDYRLVLIGSVLPDLIDKPLGVLFPQALGAGRDFAHTLLFLALVTGLGVLLWRKKKQPGGLVLAGGCLAHLILDSMWQHPEVLLWPFYRTAHSLEFPAGNPDVWLYFWINAILTKPVVYISELFGILLLGWFVLFRQGLLTRMLKSGRME
jgi:inner membrane protein